MCVCVRKRESLWVCVREIEKERERVRERERENNGERKIGYLSNTDTFFCPTGAKIRGVTLCTFT